MENDVFEVQIKSQSHVNTRRKFVSFDEEWDTVINPDPEFGNPEDLLLIRENNKLNEQISLIIENMLQTLPDIQRSIIIIRYFMDGDDRYTSQQIADVLGISRKSYYNYLNSALAHLRCALQRNAVVVNSILLTNLEEM